MKIKITPEMRISLMHAECIDLTDIVGPITAERDALAAQVEAMRYELQACQNVLHLLACAGEVTPAYADDAKKVLQATPAACLAQVKAEAGRAGFIACADHYGLQHAIATNVGIKRNADAYAERIQQGGAA